MRTSLLSIFLLSLALSLAAQDNCSNADILAKTGSWKRDPDVSLRPKNQAQITRSLDSISKIFQAAIPEPKGMEAAWYRAMGDALFPGWPAPYTFNSLYFCWYCNVHVHKLLLADE